MDYSDWVNKRLRECDTEQKTFDRKFKQVQFSNMPAIYHEMKMNNIKTECQNDIIIDLLERILDEQ